MATHSIDGPGQPGESWVTTEVAARWLCVSESTFLRLIGRKKGGFTLPGVAEWMRQHPHSEKQTWHVLDVAIVGHILRQQRGGPPPEPPAEGEEKS